MQRNWQRGVPGFDLEGFCQQTRIYPFAQPFTISELQPFGTRGGFAARHYFAVDGEYEVRVTLERTHGDAIKGLQHRNRLEVRLDRARVAEFMVGGDGQREEWNAVFWIRSLSLTELFQTRK